MVCVNHQEPTHAAALTDSCFLSNVFWIFTLRGTASDHTLTEEGTAAAAAA